ncbi:MAG: hypothetical protein ACI9FU_000803 [Granulosicoccus sp.]|jgi:hypothetical protein
MKQFIFLLIIGFIALSYNETRQSSDSLETDEVLLESQNSVEPSLVGNWKRTNNGGEERTFEFWQKTENGNSGLGFTMVGEDTVFQEIMSIVVIDDAKYLDVRGVNPTPTLFKLIEESEAHFVCVNDSNDFPKRIEYQIEEDEMTAIISAGDKMVEFQFKRIE